MEALRTVAARISVPETVESASDLTSLPKYPLKAGVDESKVDYSSGTDQELWTTATWTSSNTGVISFKEVSYPLLCTLYGHGGPAQEGHQRDPDPEAGL